MTICHAILTPIIVVVRTLVQTVREVVRTVCEWVSNTIRTVKTVVERVCSWLPWPLSEVCNRVTRVIEVVETVWNWVCREVIDRIIEWVERIVEYVAYIVRWICWVVTWPVRGPALLLCLLGVGRRSGGSGRAGEVARLSRPSADVVLERVWRKRRADSRWPARVLGCGMRDNTTGAPAHRAAHHRSLLPKPLTSRNVPVPSALAARDLALSRLQLIV